MLLLIKCKEIFPIYESRVLQNLTMVPEPGYEIDLDQEEKKWKKTRSESGKTNQERNPKPKKKERIQHGNLAMLVH